MKALPIVICVIGTRPEAIKMAPVIKTLRQAGWCNTYLLATGQHKEIVKQTLEFFDLVPDINLNVMTPNQSLNGLIAKILGIVDDLLSEINPDCVVVQGDTTTVFALATAAFNRKIPIAHVEAGLRTGNLSNPFPEEGNRRLTSSISKWHFPPTESARQNLLREGIEEKNIHVTGNTVIDALEFTLGQLPENQLGHSDKQILVTLHRRESFGDGVEQVLLAVSDLAKKYRDFKFVFPVHPNPNVRDRAYEILASIQNVKLLPPLEYPAFVQAMRDSLFIITDSGGVQEEAPYLRKPVIVTRTQTERPEAVDAGLVMLVGANRDSIVRASSRLIEDDEFYAKMSTGLSPYGDGQASLRISSFLEKRLST